ncbi:MAG: HEAT repeat domain-containing protein [Acidobacteriota bacterium]
MEPVALAAIVVGIMLVSQFTGRRSWEKAARDLGLGLTTKFGGGKQLHGEIDGLSVAVRTDSQSQNQRNLIAEVYGVHPGFSLAREGTLTRILTRDIETGDRIFDDRLRIEGDPLRAVAVLDHHARRLAHRVIVEGKGELQRGIISRTFKDIDQAREILGPMLELAKVLHSPADRDLPMALGERALTDESLAVRRQAFHHLKTSYSRSERLLSTAEGLLQAPSEQLRLEACRVLLTTDAGRGQPAADALLDIVRRRHLKASTRANGLRLLAASRYRETAVPTMTSILGQADEDPDVRRAAIDSLIQTPARDKLLDVDPVGAEEAEVLATACAHIGPPAQSRLLELLGSEEDAVRVAAVDALRRVGDLRAIPALHEVAESGTLFNAAAAKAARRAIDEIRHRLGGSQGGEMSIVALEPLDGALSAADASRAGGELSLESKRSPSDAPTGTESDELAPGQPTGRWRRRRCR